MSKDRRKGSIFQYAGMATQWIIVLMATVYLGKWLDKKYVFQEVLFIWLLPLLSLVGMMIKLIKDTSKK